jgi:putative MATE family efflux protein
MRGPSARADAADAAQAAPVRATAPPPEGHGAAVNRRLLADLLRLAWPAVLSYLLNNSYRVNDQFWIQALGGEAQAAIGATFFVQVMGFALMYLAVGGTLALVSRATGARDPAARDSFARHALVLGAVIGLALTVAVRGGATGIVSLLGLEGATAAFARDYLRTLYLFAIPLALFPVVDAIFIGRGNTRVPMTLQCLAVAMNYVLNPILIYGGHAGEAVSAPGARLFGRVAAGLGIEGMGMSGAALATGLARLTILCLGLCVLRWGMGMSLGTRRISRARLARIVRISAPVTLSIAIYSGAYWALLGLVLARLGSAATAGLGIGFQVFEGVAFPCYLGVSIAGASLVGRALGARDPAAALAVVRGSRLVGRCLGLAFTAVFLLLGRIVVPWFTQDPEVARHAILYVTVLAFSQYWVAVETANEKVLLGAGHTRPILWVGPLGNLLRVPLGALFALTLGAGAAGVWWAINLTTYLKAFLFWRLVERRRWLQLGLELSGEPRETPSPVPAVRDTR